MSESSKREKEIFLAALDVASPVERAKFVASACGLDDTLRQRIEAMLQAYATPDSFLEKPAVALGRTVDLPAAAARKDSPLEGPGTRVGLYKLLEQIGEGGMGVVFMAEQQEPVRRTVALKIIKPGMDSGQVLARFEAERQALALMDHPNIARVLDASATADGRPYFVMELVKGTPITAFCDANKLSPRQRLELFVPVCQAIQHAHQKGVIHRDIKPSNVLIALYDDRPVAKVIDFGIAKAAGNPLTERTLHTAFGAIVGTPEYMSPEQATFNQLDIDTRSDVYSLGVLLYELLTGCTPVDKAQFKEAAILEVLRVVREEEPPRPSVKLSTAQARASIAATRGGEPNKLAQMLRGELDCIVMKSLEKDRNRRYETAAGLARDVDRYLRNELVEARPPGTGYRLRKLVNRNRGPALATSLVLLAVLAGIVGTAWALVQARRQREAAIHEREAAEFQRNRAKDSEGKAVEAQGVAQASERHANAQTLGASTARHALLMEQAMSAWENQDAGEATRFLDKVAPEFQQTWETRYLRDLCRRKFRPFPMPADETLTWLMPSSDGRWLVKNTFDHDSQRCTLHVVDSHTGKTRFKFVVPADSWSFSHDGKWLVVAGNIKAKDLQLGQIKIISLESGDERPAFADIPGGVFEVDVSADDTRIAFACRGKVLICDAATGKVQQTLDNAGEINRVLFSPNGKRLAAWYAESPSKWRHVKVWDLETSKEKFSRKSGAMSVALSADGKHVAISTQTEVELWDAETGDMRWSTDKITAQSIGIDFSPDSKHIACTGEDKSSGRSPSPPKIFVLDSATGKIQRSFTANGPHGFGTGNPIFAAGLAYLPDGEHVVAGNGVWNLNHIGSEKFVCKDGSPDYAEINENGVMTMATFSSDGKRILACAGTLSQKFGQVEELLSWNAETGRQTPTIARVKGGYQVDSRAFSGNGERIIFARHDGILPVCDSVTGKELVSITVSKAFHFVAISPDGTWVASSDGKRIIIWDVASGAKKRTCEEPSRGIGSIAISPDGKRIAAVANPFSENPFTTRDRPVLIWDVETGRQTLECHVPRGNELSMAVSGTPLTFSPDSQRLAAGNDEVGTLTMWDAQTGEVLHTMKGHTTTVVSAAFSPDGKRLATGSFDQTVRLWDVETGQEVLSIKVPARVLSIAFSHDGKHLAAATGYKVVTVWEAP